MKRKQFIDNLTRLSDHNNQMNCLINMPMFCCKQSKINQRLIKRSSKLQTSHEKRNYSIQNSRVIVKGYDQYRPASAAKQQQKQSKIQIKRLKTTPISLNPKTTPQNLQLSTCNSVKAQMIIQSSKSKTKTDIYDTINQQMIKDLTKKLGIKEIVVKKTTNPVIGQSLPIQRKTYKTSITEPNDTNNKKINNGKILYTSSIVHRQSQHWRWRSKQQSQTQRRQQKIAMRRQLHKNYRKPFVPPPKITAKAYIIYQSKKNNEEPNILSSFNSKTSYEVASLTKIMTCIISIEICQEYNIDMNVQEIVVGRMESSIGGTSAQIKKGQIYTIKQLLYGLMLPSGNDASLALAVWGGKKLLEKEEQIKIQTINISQKRQCNSKLSINDTQFSQKTSQKKTKHECYNRFLKEMNKKAKELKMSKTNYANSHGLVNNNNKSSAYDVALLSQYALRNDVFRNVVSTRRFCGVIRFSLDLAKKSTRDYQSQEDDEEFNDSSQDQENQGISNKMKRKKVQRKVEVEKVEDYSKCKDERKVQVSWENTHKLLQLKPKQYIGIKTGFTTVAGPCLASCITIQGRQFIIVVLGCGRMSLRFRQTQILRRWLYKHQGLKRKKKQTLIEQSQADEQDETKESVLNTLDDDRQIED